MAHQTKKSKLSFPWLSSQGGPGGRGFPGADGPAGPKVS